MKNTLQKDIVLQSLHALDHPTAEEAYAWIHRSFPGISKATVYRILGRLSEEGRSWISGWRAAPPITTGIP